MLTLNPRGRFDSTPQVPIAGKLRQMRCIGNIHWSEFEERVLQPDVKYWRHQRRSRAPHFSVIVLLPLNQNSGQTFFLVAAYFAGKNIKFQ